MAGTATENQCLQVIRVLGEGAFGEVLLVRSPDSAALLAVKVMDMKKFSQPDEIQAFKKEALIQKKLSDIGHDNIVRYVGIRIDDDRKVFELYLEYANGGELFDRIEPDVGIKEMKAQFYFRQLINGLDFIHNQCVVHRDIKPENLFLTRADILKIGDFGMATIYKNGQSERVLTVPCGTMPYASPQVIASKYRGPPADIWSAGVVLLVMLTGQLPWEKAHWKCPRYTFWNEKATIEPWTNIDPLLLELLYEILCENEARRATIEAIQRHEWYCKEFSDPEPAAKRARILRGSQPAAGFCNEARFQMQPMPVIAFSQPHNYDLVSQEYDHSVDPLTNISARMTRFCVFTDSKALDERIREACCSLKLEIKDRPPNQLLICDHVHAMTLLVSVYEMDVDGTKRLFVDFRRSNGDGLQFKRIFIQLRDSLNDIICQNATTSLEVARLKISG